MPELDINRVRDALHCIPPINRDLWVRCAMAVKSGLGEDGFYIWNEWSKQDHSYKKQDAKAVWKSVKPFGGVTIATLFAEAKQHGWEGQTPTITVDYEAIRRRQEAELRNERLRQQKAAKRAKDMLGKASMQPHPYFDKKGFFGRSGLVLDGLLLVPMRDYQSYQIMGVQTITEDGVKKFLPGMRARGAVFQIGRSSETFLCEGYATGLSIQAALSALYQQNCCVIVTFSASNLAHVAGMVRGKRLVVADHDESGTGEKYAEKTGLPWWMPPSIGDANDYHQAEGIDALASAINDLRLSG